MTRRIMPALCALACIALAGCAAAPPPVATPVEVRVPVPVPCKVAMPTRPAWAVDALALDADIWAQMKALRAERHQRIGYITELEAAAGACQ